MQKDFLVFLRSLFFSQTIHKKVIEKLQWNKNKEKAEILSAFQCFCKIKRQLTYLIKWYRMYKINHVIIGLFLERRR